ncbi:hypothetical protein [Streptomyces tsukubensis]|uniref:hypothetical protein n=1 Tax=Streptomyces tsukubensis TaxID=83656 RepID=UPI00117E4AFE|nr:hypothetical protein [Streptomyces tsukubensis]QFR93813.1 hypothetical protein GBW32_12970 [Streptomyces tsukubensis]
MSQRSTENALSIEKIMLKLHNSCTDHIEPATRSNELAINRVLHLEADIADWLEALKSKPEAQQLQSAHRDFGLAFYAAMTGLYRQAFSNLRSFLEVSIGATYLSSHEFKRRQWVSGKLDISWKAITSTESGLYSTPFLQEFCPEAIGEQDEMLGDLKRAYRRCSEYIHGNVSTSQMLPTEISYREDIVKEWIAVAESALGATIHCLMVRYYKDFSQPLKGIVEDSLEDHFSHLVSVRKMLGLPLEGTHS